MTQLQTIDLELIIHSTFATPNILTASDVEWDNGRNLMLTLPPDRIEILRNTTGI
ncbi:MAG: hypothetical protein ACK58L_21080 [Planctomycetota bacterium]